MSRTQAWPCSRSRVIANDCISDSPSVARLLEQHRRDLFELTWRHGSVHTRASIVRWPGRDRPCEADPREKGGVIRE